MAIFLLTACGNETIDDIYNIDFNIIDGIQILTTEQVAKNKVAEKYEVSEQKEVSDFVNMFRSSTKIKKMETPFPVGDGVITLIAKGSHQYAFRYYKEQKQLLDLHKGILYQFPEGLAEILNRLGVCPTKQGNAPLVANEYSK